MKSKNSFLVILISLLIGSSAFVKVNSQVVLQRCDLANLWTGSNSISINSGDYKEGMASINFTGNGTDWFKKKFSQTDVGIDESGWFNLWIYVSDVSKMSGDGQIELSSSGGPDTDEYSWSVSGLGLADGWNNVQLQLSAANKTGSPSLSAINYFRIYQVLTGEITVKLDYLRFTSVQNPVVATDPLDIEETDYTTLDGKVMFGYQGWFSHPDDGSELARWRHWGTLEDANTIGVEMFPDMREYEMDEKLETGLTFADGSMARVYSAYTKKTVMRHMKWLRDYSLDGVFLQRFNVSLRDSKLRALRDTVTANVMAGCEKYDRTFVNMWDLSGLSAGSMDELINDWKHLVDDLKITESPNYLWHRGKPLVAIWGFTVRDELPDTDLQQLIDFFRNSPDEKYRASIMLGTNHDFFNKSSWQEELSQVDVISPWAVGRFGTADGHQSFLNSYVKPGQDWCDNHNIDFLPVIWPGFSWFNLKGPDHDKNQIPRNGGDFFWTQANRVISSNAKMVYIAMFDEVDEATAMFKLAETAEQSPAQGYWLSLDADGEDLPSDWYLRCAKLTTEVVHGNTLNRGLLGTPPDGIDDFSAVVQSTLCATTMGKITFSYPNVDAGTLLEFSIDGGQTYPYVTPSASSTMETGDLSSGVYNVWVRRADGNFPTDLGPFTVFDLVPEASAMAIDATCGYEDGEISLKVGSNPYVGPIQFSTDGGNTYATATTEGTWTYQHTGFAPGDYDIWARWADEKCPTLIDNVTIGKDPIEITLFSSVDGEAFVPYVAPAVRACPGYSFDITAEPAEDSWTWSWTGDESFAGSTRTVLLSDIVTSEMYGKYEVSYINETTGCANSLAFNVWASPDCPVGINDNIDAGSFPNVFPNPTDGIIRFEFEQSENYIIDISDLSGRKVMSQVDLSSKGNAIDLSTFENGIFVYRLEDQDGNYNYGRIIKK